MLTGCPGPIPPNIYAITLRHPEYVIMPPRPDHDRMGDCNAFVEAEAQTGADLRSVEADGLIDVPVVVSGSGKIFVPNEVGNRTD